MGPTTDAEAIIHGLSEDKPKPVSRLRRLELRAQVASAFREMRDNERLSREAFAPMVDMSVDDLEAVEDADYPNDDRLLEMLEEARAIIRQET